MPRRFLVESVPLQTEEETVFCTGCHSTLGVTAHQDFERGRDPVPKPATQVFEEIEGNGTTALGNAGLLFEDGRIWPDWE